MTCGSCHVGVENEDGSQQSLGDADVNTFPLDHMIRNGAVFAADTAEAATGSEQCASCHAVGMLKGVDSVHNSTTTVNNEKAALVFLGRPLTKLRSSEWIG